jgi:hypothetical protein
MVLAKIAALSIHDDSPVESKFGDDWIPELSKLKKTLTAEWRARFKDLSSESTPTISDRMGQLRRSAGIATRTVIGAEIQAADSKELVQEVLAPIS